MKESPIPNIVPSLTLNLPRLLVAMMRLVDGAQISKNFSGLNPTKVNTLIAISVHDGDITMSEASDYVGIQKGAFTRVVDSLCKSGLMERVRSEDDRRKIYLVLTESGEKKANQAHKDMSYHLEKTITKLTREEQTTLNSSLSDILRLLNKL
jgi:DNA-binding MarR family transcriptional regulator